MDAHHLISRPQPHRLVAWIAGVTVLLLGLPLSLAAQTTPKVFRACYVASTGTVYRIGEPDLPTECATHKGGKVVDIEFVWTDGDQAIRSGDAAGGDLGGNYPNPTVTALRGEGISGASPATGQVLTYDGANWTPTTPASGVTDHGSLSGLTDDDHPQYLLADGVRYSEDGFAVSGKNGLGTIPVTGPGIRLMWYPGKGAFRAGGTAGEWDDANVGNFSAALGQATTASGNWSVAMGYVTTASGQYSTAMGHGTVASGFASTAMGAGKEASGQYSTAMGYATTASGAYSTAMGFETVASGIGSTAMGGETVANQLYSTAMGYRASTNGYAGAFVYGDHSTSGTLNAAASNQFMVRAAGGTIFYSNPDLTAGVSLAPGAGAWATISDVNRKNHFRDVDGEAVLQLIEHMPIRSWNYKAQSPSIRHLGPTAQDFYAAFGLGGSDTTITTTDIDGVNLLAVQALVRRTQEQAREIEKLRADVAALQARIEQRR